MSKIRINKRKEYKALLNYADDDFRKCILTYRATGMRPSEIHALTKADIDVENRKLVIRKGKGNKHRLVDCSKFLIATLSERSEGKPLPLTQNAFRLRLKRAVNKLKIHDLIPYDFRRARIQKLVDSGKPIGYVALQVGHNSFDMLARYYGIRLR